MELLQTILAWTRITLYFFTMISLVIAGIAIYKPLDFSRQFRSQKSIMLFSLAFVFFFLAISGIARAIGYISIGVKIIDYLLTPTMIIVSSFCWRFIILTSRPSFLPREKDINQLENISTS